MLQHTYHLDSDGAKKSLPNYFSIISGDRKAKFQVCKNLDEKLAFSKKILESCVLCEHKCKVNRVKGEKGFCMVLEPRINSQFMHLGEEPELVPSYTIFFAGCNFRCAFCQNYDISQNPSNGVEMTPHMLARLINNQHARNVNWVGGEPTPNLPYIIEVLNNLEKNISQVWNSNMYMSTESMNLLDGIIDIYLTDFKYGNDDCARRLSKIENYSKVVKRNHLLAKKQCEMLVRHLVLPGHFECCTKPVLDWISENMKDVRFNLMDQYRPEYQAFKYAEIDHQLGKEEYNLALGYALALGLNLVD